MSYVTFVCYRVRTASCTSQFYALAKYTRFELLINHKLLTIYPVNTTISEIPACSGLYARCDDMKTIILIVLFIIFPVCPLFCETAWESYLSYPTPERASKVSQIEYSPGSYVEEGDYYSPDLEVLQNQVLAGDSESFRLVFRLMEKANGGLLEDLTVILSHTIRARPEFFLNELSELQPSSVALKDILLMPGLEYTDHPDARKYELKMRAKAIQSVKATRTKSFRKRCLVILRKELASNS